MSLKEELDIYLQLMLRWDNPIYFSLVIALVLILMMIYIFRKHVIPKELRHQQEKNELETKYNKQLKELNVHLQDTLEDERRRIAYELHDSLGQNLSVVKLIIEKCLSRTAEAEDREGIEKAVSLLEGSIKEVKDIAYDLNPRAVKQLGLSPALYALCSTASENSRVKSTVDIPNGLHRLPDKLELCLYRITQEALNNILKHSNATEFNLSLHIRKGIIRLMISDDGKGFDAEKIYSGSNGHTGMGLVSMRHRAEQFGGKVKIESSKGQGTVIIVEIPEEGNSAEVIFSSRKESSL